MPLSKLEATVIWEMRGQGMVCGEKPARYHVRHTLQCVTMAETRMGQMPYTEFMTLPTAQDCC